MSLNSMEATTVASPTATYAKAGIGQSQSQSVELGKGQSGAASANITGTTADIQKKSFSGAGLIGVTDSKWRQQDDPVYDKVLKQAVDKVNKLLSSDDRKLEISIHEKTKEVLVKVVDTNTNETIKEIPPKKIVDLVVSLCEMAGVIFDAKG